MPPRVLGTLTRARDPGCFTHMGHRDSISQLPCDRNQNKEVFKMARKQDNRTFEEVVRSIASSEEDVDRVLKAAKMDRREGDFWERYLMEYQKQSFKETIVSTVFGLAALAMVFVPLAILLLR